MMHDRIGNCLTQRGQWILRNLLAPKLLNSVGHARVAFNESQTFLNVTDNAASEILAIQHIHFVNALEQQASDIRLVKKTPWLTRKEQHTGVTKSKLALHQLGRLNVHQHFFGTRATTNAAHSNPSLIFLAVKVLRVLKARAG